MGSKEAGATRCRIGLCHWPKNNYVVEAPNRHQPTFSKNRSRASIFAEEDGAWASPQYLVSVGATSERSSKIHVEEGGVSGASPVMQTHRPITSLLLPDRALVEVLKARHYFAMAPQTTGVVSVNLVVSTAIPEDNTGALSGVYRSGAAQQTCNGWWARQEGAFSWLLETVQAPT